MSDPVVPFRRIVVPTPYAAGPATVSAIRSDPITLIACGPHTPAAENALTLGLAEIGLVPEQIARIVITHGHPDHYGMAARLRELSGARVLVGEHDMPKLVRDQSALVATGRLLLQAGMPMETLLEMGERERDLGNIRPRVEGAEPLSGGGRGGVEGGVEVGGLDLPGRHARHSC